MTEFEEDRIMDECPCTSGKPYEQCCEPIHRGTRPAATAEQLMRARYSAFARHEVSFIKESTHPRERRGFDMGATRAWSEQSEWKGLEIVKVKDGGEDDNRGMVEFIAHYTREDEEIEHHEVATFKKTGGRWFFLDGRMVPRQPNRREQPKVGRNDPCPCGSGKKYKKCCGK